MKLIREVTARHMRLLWAFSRSGPELRRQRQLGFFLVFVPFTMTAFVGLNATLGKGPWWFVSPALGLVVSSLLSRYFDAHGEKAFLSANTPEIGPQEFVLTEDGFGNATVQGSTFHKWPAVLGVDEASAITVITCRNHVYALPTEPGDGEARAFAEKVWAQWQVERAK